MMDELKNSMDSGSQKVFGALKGQLTKLRTGRASASVLEGLTVDYYGTPTPLPQIGQVSTPEARLLQIQPFDKSLMAAIEKTILGANLGLTPSNDGNIIRIPFPALTEEKRKGIVKEIKKIGEDAKIQIRNLRRDQNERIKKAQKDKDISEDESKKLQGEIQKKTDDLTKQVDELVNAKESEVLQV